MDSVRRDGLVNGAGIAVLNLLLMPLGACSLAALSASGGGVPFWIAAVLFWIYCVANYQIENMGEWAPDSTAIIQIAALGMTVILGMYGVYRLLF